MHSIVLALYFFHYFPKDADPEMVPVTPGDRGSADNIRVQSVSVCGVDRSRWRPSDFREEIQ